MEEWNARKSMVIKRIYEELKKEGKLPRNGKVIFDARIKPDPKNKDKAHISVDKLQIIERKSSSEGQTGTESSSSENINRKTINCQVNIPDVEMGSIDFSGSMVIRDYIDLQEIDLPGGPRGVSKRALGGANEKEQRGDSVAAGPAPGEEASPQNPPVAPVEEKSWWQKLFGILIWDKLHRIMWSCPKTIRPAKESYWP